MTSRRLWLFWLAGLAVALGAAMATGCFGGGSKEPATVTEVAAATQASTTVSKSTVNGELYSLTPRELTAGEPLPLPDGVRLLVQPEMPSGATLPDFVAVERVGGELKHWNFYEGLMEAVKNALPSTAAEPASWAVSPDGTEIAAMVCSSPDGCWCGAPSRDTGSFLFVSKDGGQNWSLTNEFSNRISLSGFDDAGSLLTSMRLGCGTNGTANYWTEPGHVAVPRPAKCGSACFYSRVPGLGWRWRHVLGAIYELDGSISLPPQPLANSARMLSVGADGTYWSLAVLKGKAFVQANAEGTVVSAWHTSDESLWPVDSIGNGLFIGRRARTVEGIDHPVEQFVLIDLGNSTVHAIQDVDSIAGPASHLADVLMPGQ